MVSFTTDVRKDLTVVTFELSEGIITPEELVDAVESAPEVDATHGVVLSGRGPVWLYAALVHHYHATVWVATHDPRRGAVVVESHTFGPRVGSVIEL